MADKKFITARKGDFGFWGSIFFHALLITLIAGLVVYYLTGFYGTLRITEGQELRLTRDSLLRIDKMPLLGFSLPDLTLRFNKFSSTYVDDYTATDFNASFDIKDAKTGETWVKNFKINDPFRYGGIEFLMLLQGFSPNFILYKNEVPVFDAYVALEFDFENEASFTIEQEGILVKAQFFPDMARADDGGIYTKTFRPKNPYFGLEVSTGDRVVFRKLLGMGESGTFGPYRIVFNDLRNWITINLVRETGIGFFFVCSMIGLAGLVVRVIDPERKIVTSIHHRSEYTAVNFYHFAKHFDGMLEEQLEEILDKFKKETT